MRRILYTVRSYSIAKECLKSLPLDREDGLLFTDEAPFGIFRDLNSLAYFLNIRKCSVYFLLSSDNVQRWVDLIPKEAVFIDEHLWSGLTQQYSKHITL